MNITKNQVNRIERLYDKMTENLEEIKNILRQSMTRHEYELFRYRTLGHLEPGLTEDCDWLAGPGVDPLDKVIRNLLEDVSGCEEETNNEKETNESGERTKNTGNVTEGS